MRGRPKITRNPAIGPLFLATREAWGLTQEQMGELLGLHHTAISAFERGMIAPSLGRCLAGAATAKVEKVREFWGKLVKLRQTETSVTNDIVQDVQRDAMTVACSE